MKTDIHMYSLIQWNSNLLTMRKVSEKVVQNIKTHILCPVPFFLEKRAVYGRVWKKMVKPDMPDDNTTHALCILDT